MTSGFFGSSLSLECKKSIINPQTFWIYSANGREDIFLIEDNQGKYKLNSENTLSILNLEFNDDGFYACGYSLPENIFIFLSKYNLYVKDIPDLFISIDNTLKTENIISNITYGNTYLLTCIAKDSRPTVKLTFFDIVNARKNLEDYGNRTVSSVQRKVDCNSNSLCTTILSLSLTFNDERLKSTNQIICEAINTTNPYDLLVTSNIFVSVNDPTGITSKT
jgi:hypothetical protein